MSVADLVEGVLSQKRLYLARLISMIEDEDSLALEALSQLYKHTGKGHIIGVTGPPGSGKSSLVTKLTAEFRKRSKTIGIICVDPSSPFTGGALLGDRIRMQEHSLDDVYEFVEYGADLIPSLRLLLKLPGLLIIDVLVGYTDQAPDFLQRFAVKELSV